MSSVCRGGLRLVSLGGMIEVGCVLVVGSGGREHALAWALGRSPHVDRLLIAPGNGGTAFVSTFVSASTGDYTDYTKAESGNVKAENVAVMADDLSGLVSLCCRESVDLVVVGPEDPLAAGIVDMLNSAGIAAFGPSAACAQLEASKSYCNQFLIDNRIPTAAAESFRNPDAALAYLDSLPELPVVKATGLMAGKGVIVPETKTEAVEAIRTMLIDRQFGPAGEELLIEERLIGREVSVLAFCDGEMFALLPPAQDYKRIHAGDTGPNTGGMGAVAPTPVIDDLLLEQVGEQIISPTLAALRQAGTPYRGLLYVGLMITDDGPKVLEFNCRFGDPETQAVVRLLRSDLFEIMRACATGSLSRISVDCSSDVAVAVVMASAGYPVSGSDPVAIFGIDDAAEKGCVVFHAGTKLIDGVLHTDGGRVLAVTAVGPDLATATAMAHSGVASISFEGAQHRVDIGLGSISDSPQHGIDP